MTPNSVGTLVVSVIWRWWLALIQILVLPPLAFLFLCTPIKREEKLLLSPTDFSRNSAL